MKIIQLLSGGMDSVTLLYYLISRGNEIKCLSIDYGQRHKREIQAAAEICGDLDIEHRTVSIPEVTPLLKGSSQTDDVPVPEGHYAQENMKLTVVPNRNMIMLSIAGAWAISEKFDAVAYACHSGDHAIYPDCRKVYVNALNKAFALCDWQKLKLISPFIDKTKTDIAALGGEMRVPFEKTWTCYKGLERHCGNCGACNERKEAFRDSCVIDVTDYDDPIGAYRVAGQGSSDEPGATD